MTRQPLAPDVEREIEELRRDLARERPALAAKLDRVVDRIIADPTSPAGYVSTGEAAAALGVSANTVKKWVRLGIVTDFWTLPRSGYVKIARSEVERIRAQGAPQMIEEPR